MRKCRTCLLVTFLTLLVSFSSFSQGNYPKTLLWRISGKGLQKPSYLFGTMHLKDPRIFQFSDSLYHFLEQAEGYAMEIDPERAIELLMHTISEPDTSGFLHEVMDTQEFKKAAGNLEKQFGIPANSVTKKQAWLYKMGMGNDEEEKPGDMDAPIDTYLYNIAKRQGKWVGGIEDVEDQFNILDELFRADDFIAGKKKGDAAMEKLIKLYISQDLNSIEKWIIGSDSSFKDVVLTRRNIKMSRRMDSLAHIRSHFFAVGAAHLPGEEGVIQLLKGLGYQVEPVISNKKVAPSSYQYKAIDLPWTAVKNEEETFSVLMPGKAVDFKPYGDIMKMKMYIDMGTGLFYFATGMHLPGNKNRDSVLLKMAASYANKAKVLKQENIVINNRRGVALLTVNNGYYCQLKLFSEGDQVVLMMVGCQKKSQLSYADVNKFFESLHITAKTASNEWFHHKDKKKAIAISFPGKPSSYDQLNQQFAQKEGAEVWNISNLSYVDPGSQTFYMLVIKETKPGYYIQSDQQIFEEAKAGIENNPDMKLTHYQTGMTDKNISCLWMNGKSKKDNYNIRSYHLVRANKTLSLMVVYDEALADTAQIHRFFQSFKLMDFEANQWQIQKDSMLTFSTWAPSGFTTTITDSITQSSQSFAFDENTGASYYVEKQTFAPYYWTENDSTLYANLIRGQVSYEDSLLLDKEIMVNGLKGREFKIQLKKEARNFKHGIVVVNGDTLYMAYTILPKADTPPNYSDFLTNLKLTGHAKTTNLYTNKARQLLNDLNATDSSTFAKASEAFSNAPFAKSDLHYLHTTLLRPLFDFDEFSYCMHDQVVEKVISLADSSTVAFIAQHYLEVEKEELKFPLLNILASIKTNESYTLLKKLLLNNKPVSGNVGPLGYKLADSLLLSQSIIPDLLPLFADTLFSNSLPRVVNELLDSNLLELSVLEPYKQSILDECKRLSVRYEQAEGSTVWNIEDWISLVGKLNTKESTLLLKQIAKSKFPYVKYEAVIALLASNQTIAASVIEKLAADNYYRVYLYKALKEKKKLSLFPVKYANQQSIAQSLLYSYASDDDDYEPTAISFITTKQVSYKGKMTTFYLYKVVYAYEEGETESFLGVVGAFNTKAGIATEAEVINTSSDLFDPKQMQKQLAQLLEESMK